MGCNKSKVQHQKSQVLMNSKISPGILIKIKQDDIDNHYLIVDQIGEGGFGIVHKAVHKISKQIVAIKIMSNEKVVMEDQNKLLGDFSILKELDHPNIVRLLECYEDESNLYFVTEFCDGKSLYENIMIEEHYTEQKAAQIMKQVLSALNYCHKLKIVHRDIKLENILFERQTKQYKLIDFGSARFLKENEKMKLRIGTLFYMAPEVLNKQYSIECDIWACGVLLYILLSGQPPFDGRENQVTQKIKNCLYSFKSEAWESISEDAKDLIRQMLEVDPKKRISAQEALESKWIKTAQSKQLNPSTIENLKKFETNSKFTQAIKLYMINTFQNKADLKQLIYDFKVFDINNDGVVSEEEMIKILQKTYKNQTEAVVKQIIKEVDLNNSGKIDFSEFVLAVDQFKKFGNKDKIKKMFQMIDTDKNGQLAKEEVQEILGGIQMDEKQWANLLQECDKNKDGKISFDEFFDLLEKEMS